MAKRAQAGNDGDVQVLAPTEPIASPEEDMERVRQIIMGRSDSRAPEMEHLREIVGTQILREIIFGTHMEDYERRFADLRRETERALADLRTMQDNVNEFEKTQVKRVDTLEQETRRSDEELRREVERLRAQENLLQQVVTRVQQEETLSKSLSDNISELRENLTQQERDQGTLRTTVFEHRDQQDRNLDGLKRELRQAENDLRAELRRLADHLGDQKTDRKDLSAMFMEIATRLETGSPTPGRR